MAEEILKGKRELRFPFAKYRVELEDLGLKDDLVVTFKYISEEDNETLPQLIERKIEIVDSVDANGQIIKREKVKNEAEWNKVWNERALKMLTHTIKEWNLNMDITTENIKKLPSIILDALKLNALLFNSYSLDELKNSN